MAQTCGISPEELRVRDGEYPASETPLETAWTFWYDKKTSDRKESDQYMEGLRQLGSFNTVQGFYRHYAYLLRPSDLPRDHNCYMFRKHYKPMWEEFPEGGCWIIRIKRKTSHNYVNHMWENLLLACIGEAFEMPDVVGCVLSTRLKDDVLSVWNLSNRETPARFRIGERLKEVLDLNITALIQYKDHMQSLQDYSTYRNARNYMFAPSPNVTPLQGTLPTPLQTPLHTHTDAGDQDLDQGMLPPAAIDAMLPPAAVDTEGFGAGDAWSGVGGAQTFLGAAIASAGRSPALSASAAPFTPPTQLLKSPPLSAQAAPWVPSGASIEAMAAAAAAAAAAPGAAAAATTPAAGPPPAKSWAAIAAAAAKGSPPKGASSPPAVAGAAAAPEQPKVVPATKAAPKA